MKVTPTPMRLALMAAFGVASTMSAQAAPIPIVQSDTFVSSTGTASDTVVNGTAATNSTLSDPTSTLNKFDRANGVLTGVTVGLTSTRSHVNTLSVGTATGSAQKSATTSGSSTAGFSVEGFSSGNLGTLNPGGLNCTAAKNVGCSVASNTTTSSNIATNYSQALGAADLNSFVGAGTTTLTRSATATTELLTNTFSVTGTATSKLTNWEGTVSLTYDYLNHAAPSFDSGSELLMLDLDFGTVALGSMQQLGFSFFNWIADSVGLLFDSFSEVSDPGGKFSTTMAAGNLVPATGSTYDVIFDTMTAGTFAGQYLLNFKDNPDQGATGSQYGFETGGDTGNNYILTLNVTGTVRDQQVSGVPEPSLLALLGAGLAGMTYSGRRRRR